MSGQLPWLLVHQTDQGTVKTESVLFAPYAASRPQFQRGARGSDLSQSVLFSELCSTYRDCSFTRTSACPFTVARVFGFSYQYCAISPPAGDPQLIAGWGLSFNTNSCSLHIHSLLQVWTGYEGPNNPHDPSPIVLGVQAQSAVDMDNECMQTYAALRYVRIQRL